MVFKTLPLSLMWKINSEQSPNQYNCKHHIIHQVAEQAICGFVFDQQGCPESLQSDSHTAPITVEYTRLLKG